MTKFTDKNMQELAEFLFKKGGYNDIAEKIMAPGVTADMLNEDIELKKRLASIPGAYDIIKAPDTSAPPGMTEEETRAFFTKDGKFDEAAANAYKEKENKRLTERKEERALAEEYKKSNDGSYYNSWAANDYAKEQYAKGNDNAALANEIAAKIAFAADFMPPPFSYAGPAIRTGQIIANEGIGGITNHPVSLATDWGTSFLGPAKGAAKTGYESVKQLAGGSLGKVFESKVGKAIEKAAEAKDALKKAFEYKKVRQGFGRVNDNPFGHFKSWVDWAVGKTNDEILAKAKEIKEIMPNTADEMISNVRGLSWKPVETGTFNKTRGEAVDYFANKSTADLNKQMTRGTKSGQPSMYPYVGGERSNLLPNDRFLEIMTYEEPNLLSKIGLGGLQSIAKPALKSITSVYKNTSSEPKPSESDKKLYIQNLIKDNVHRWRLGLEPDVTDPYEVEAYEIWKRENE